MSTPTIARTDKSTQTTPPSETALSPGTVPPPGTAPPGTAPSPGTTPAKKHDVAPYSPAPSLLPPEHQTNEISESSAGNATSPAQPGVKSPPKEIPLLGTVPDDFGPAYDYLGKVKELADEIEPGLYETYFERRFAETSTRIRLHTRAEQDINYGCAFSWEVVPQEIYVDIVSLRENISRISQGGEIVLLVQAINKAGIQAIGMAFNVNPCFFARHLLPKDKGGNWPGGLDQLGGMFDSYVRRQSKVESQVADHWFMGRTDWSSAVGHRTPENGIAGSRDRLVSWSPGDHARVTIGNENVGFRSCRSDAQRSRNCCKA
jgi:hypothetical protein